MQKAIWDQVKACKLSQESSGKFMLASGTSSMHTISDFRASRMALVQLSFLPIMLLLIVTTVATVAFGISIYKRYCFVKKFNQIPGLCDSFLGLGIRSIYALLRIRLAKSNSGVAELTCRFVGAQLLVAPEGVYRLWFGPLPHVLISSPEMVESVISSNEIIRKGMPYRFMTEVLGKGLLTGEGDKWRQHRKLLTPAFHFRVLEQFSPVINKCGNILIEKLEQIAMQNDGIVADFHDPVLNCALDVICETAMGQSVNAQLNPESEYVRAVKRYSTMFMERAWSPIGYIPFLYFRTAGGAEWKKLLVTVKKFTGSVLKHRKEGLEHHTTAGCDENKPELSEKKREPFIDILIRENMMNPTEFTDQDVEDEVETFMAAGHDTTGWAIVWTTYLLGLHPDVQERLYNEIDSYFDNSSDHEITPEGLKRNFSYCEAIVKESMRLYPPGAINTRTTDRPIQIGPYTVPEGVQLVLCFSAIHRNPKHWPDPERFDPERFLNNHKRHPYAYLPFSAGPRNCIGQKFAMLEMKATLVKIFRKFKVTSLDPQDKVFPTVAFMLKPEVPVRVRLELRSPHLVTHL